VDHGLRFSRLYTFNQRPVEVTNTSRGGQYANNPTEFYNVPFSDNNPIHQYNDFQSHARLQHALRSPNYTSWHPLTPGTNPGQSLRRQDPKEIDRPSNELRDSISEFTEFQSSLTHKARPYESTQLKQSNDHECHAQPDPLPLQRSPIFEQILSGVTPFKILHPSLSRASLQNQVDLSSQIVNKAVDGNEGDLSMKPEDYNGKVQSSADNEHGNLTRLNSPQTTECPFNPNGNVKAETESVKIMKRETADSAFDSHHSKAQSIKTSLEPETEAKGNGIASDKKSLIHCTCKKSKCLKLYCECFAAQKVCGDSCGCSECFNKEEYQDVRNFFLKETLDKNPNAFKSKFKKLDQQNMTLHTRGCNCKKTGCIKRYCECYSAGTKCTPLCKCSECCNFGEESKAVEVEKYHERVLRKRKRKSRNFVQSLLERLGERNVNDRSAGVS
jgi:hypothetical protein